MQNIKILMKNLQEAQVQNKNVLVRIDTDVKIENGIVTDDERLKASLPTLKYLLENGAKVTIIGHIGRPKGKEVAELKMRPVEDKLIELLGTHTNWQILENLRFNAGEEANDSEFAKQLATGQDLFVQDAFATCHRAHASTAGIKEILPSYLGLNVRKEIENLTKLGDQNDITMIIGGRKAKDKLPVIEKLASKTKVFLIGGVVASIFLKIKGCEIGISLVEAEVYEKTTEILNTNKDKIKLPVDVVISKSIQKPIEEKILKVSELNKDLMADYYIVDIGPETIKIFKEEIFKAQTIFMNGNMGISEVPEFSRGTQEITQAITESRASKYVGGGDTATFVRKNNLAEKFDFISTGGGATLEYLAGKNLPGLE